MARPEAVAETLNRDVKPGSMFELDFRGGDPRQFRGEVKPSSFRIVRRVQIRNSFAPVLEGQVTEIEGGSEVTVSMFVPNGLLLFVIGWTVLASGAAMLVVQQMMLEQTIESVMTFSMATVPFVGGCIAWLAFSLEASKSERALRQLLPPFVSPELLKP